MWRTTLYLRRKAMHHARRPSTCAITTITTTTHRCNSRASGIRPLCFGFGGDQVSSIRVSTALPYLGSRSSGCSGHRYLGYKSGNNNSNNSGDSNNYGVPSLVAAIGAGVAVAAGLGTRKPHQSRLDAAGKESRDRPVVLSHHELQLALDAGVLTGVWHAKYQLSGGSGGSVDVSSGNKTDVSSGGGGGGGGGMSKNEVTTACIETAAVRCNAKMEDRHAERVLTMDGNGAVIEIERTNSMSNGDGDHVSSSSCFTSSFSSIDAFPPASSASSSTSSSSSTHSPSSLLLIGMFDGHSGWRCADTVSSVLPAYISAAFAEEETSCNLSTATAAEVLQRAFLSMDHDLIWTSVDTCLTATEVDHGNNNNNNVLLENTVAAALSGACACVLLTDGRNYLVGNTGDCRAVLGCARPGGRWGATPLSRDQTADEPSEALRIRREHPPGEEATCVRRGRVLGRLQPSRSFGDAKYKWPQTRCQALGARKVRNYHTPPYVTARPVVTQMRRHADDRFIILATDGLWDVVDSTTAVECVGAHLDNNDNKNGISSDNTNNNIDNETLCDGAAQALVALALRRYAAEAADGDVKTLLAMPPPECRKQRDDITVTVVKLTDLNQVENITV